MTAPASADATAVITAATAPVAAAMTAVNSRLESLLPPSLGGLAPVIYRHMLQSGGKRLRPLLTLLSCAAAGGDPMNAVSLAVAAEVLHLASLIHDDVIDEAERRRGYPSARQRWGNRAAVLVGDFLVAEVFRGLADELQKDTLGIMARTVAVMAQAELDFSAAGEEITESDYQRNIEGKTGALMGAVCEVGALAADNREGALRLRAFGQKLGEAFQIRDDLLDLYGDEAVVGKPVLQDLGKGQWTLPVLYALRTATADQAAALRALLAAAPSSPPAAREAASLAAALGGRAYAEQRADAAVSEALAALEALPPSAARDELARLAEFIVRRER